MCVLSREPQSFYKESLLGKVTPSFKHQYYVNLIQIWGALSPSGQTQYASGRDPISKACMLSWQLPPCPELLRSSCSSLALCSIFLFFWFLPHFVLLITVDGMATAFFFFTLFDLLLYNHATVWKNYPIFTCNIHFLTTSNFCNYYSTLVSIVTICLSEAASPAC